MRRTLLMIVMLMLIGCDNANGGGDDSTTPIVTEQISPVEIYLDSMSFPDAFRIEHRAKGEGHTFWWHGEEYTTDYIEELNIFATIIDGGRWVLNSNDLDDFCKSNILDDCNCSIYFYVIKLRIYNC